ncbi:MAG: hypothetical protein QME66_08200 [Candidatus Eisenbacteria bacterium]|nr:hypothetical protein [Candidatus Eisenbacteria bacterium]
MSGLPPWGNSRRKRKLTPEGSVKSAIRDLCAAKDWLIVKVIQGIGSTQGAPDLFIGANRKWYAVEVKRDLRARLSPDQIVFQSNCERLGLTYLVICDATQLLHRIEGTQNANWGRGALSTPQRWEGRSNAL